jgi:hypothetical protein
VLQLHSGHHLRLRQLELSAQRAHRVRAAQRVPALQLALRSRSFRRARRRRGIRPHGRRDDLSARVCQLARVRVHRLRRHGERARCAGRWRVAARLVCVAFARFGEQNSVYEANSVVSQCVAGAIAARHGLHHPADALLGRDALPPLEGGRWEPESLAYAEREAVRGLRHREEAVARGDRLADEVGRLRHEVRQARPLHGRLVQRGHRLCVVLDHHAQALRYRLAPAHASPIRVLEEPRGALLVVLREHVGYFPDGLLQLGRRPHERGHLFERVVDRSYDDVAVERVVGGELGDVRDSADASDVRARRVDGRDFGRGAVVPPQVGGARVVAHCGHLAEGLRGVRSAGSVGSTRTRECRVRTAPAARTALRAVARVHRPSEEYVQAVDALERSDDAVCVSERVAGRRVRALQCVESVEADHRAPALAGAGSVYFLLDASVVLAAVGEGGPESRLEERLPPLRAERLSDAAEEHLAAVRVGVPRGDVRVAVIEALQLDISLEVGEGLAALRDLVGGADHAHCGGVF